MTAENPPPLPPITAAADAMFRCAREWGVRSDHPEGIFVQALGNLLVAFEARLDTTSRTTEDAIRNIVRRAAVAAMADVSRTVRRTETWRGLALGAAAVVLSIGMGFALGYDVSGSARAGAAAQLAQIASQCAATTYPQAGGKACKIRLWVTPP